MSSSPSTRFTGEDVDGLTEDQMPPLPLKEYMQVYLFPFLSFPFLSFPFLSFPFLSFSPPLPSSHHFLPLSQEYAATKAQGEMACRAACSPELLTVAVAPHQVYGPRDNLFLPNVLEAAGTERLRVFSCARTGYGKSRVCFTHVDNYCHGLILAAEGLYEVWEDFFVFVFVFVFVVIHYFVCFSFFHFSHKNPTPPPPLNREAPSSENSTSSPTLTPTPTPKVMLSSGMLLMNLSKLWAFLPSTQGGLSPFGLLCQLLICVV